MKNAVKICLVALVLTTLLCGVMFVLSTGGQNEQLDNYPYEPDTPVPAAHNGVFMSDGYGSMAFDGDGETVIINFQSYLSSITGIPEGEHEAKYEFLSGNLPPHGSIPVRYDVAHELKITIDDESYILNLGIAAENHQSSTSGVGTVTETRIPIVYSDDYKFYSVIFEKE